MRGDLKTDELVDGQVPPLVELRVHGVGGTSPESMLDAPRTVLVRGDDVSGFYRRPGGSAVEAYSWGGITSKSPRRALWVLMAPFAFLNVAGWMLPRGEDRSNRFETALIRWVALYSTVMVALLVGQPFIETLAFECAGSGACRARHSWLGWTEGLQQTPGRRLVIGALFPLVFLVVLRWLARRSHHRYEEAELSGPTEVDSGPSPSIGDRKFWRQGEAFVQLARLHFVAGCTVIGFVVAGSVWQLRERTPSSVLGVDLIGILAWASLLWLLVLAFWVAATPPAERGPGWLQRLEDAPHRIARRIRLPHTSILITSLLLLAIALVSWMEPRSDVSDYGSVWYANANVFAAIFGAVVPVLVLYVTLLRQTDWSRSILSPLSVDLETPEEAETEAEVRTGFGGYGTVVAGLFGFVVAITVLGALNGGVANWLGTDPSSRVDDVGVLVIALSIVIAIVLFLQWVKVGRDVPSPKDLHTSWPGDEGKDSGGLTFDRKRWLEGIAFRIRMRSLITGVDRALSVFLVAVTVVLVVEIAGEAKEAYTGDGFSVATLIPFWQSFESIGWWLLVVGFPAAAIWLVRKVYTDAESRKAVGIVWDIATFFPRWYHPFAPPSYAGRAVPELRERLETLTASGSKVILSAHSQGSVLALATVAGLTGTDTLDDVALLTHGSPIGRLYLRFFPRHFAEPIQSVAAALAADEGGRWYNLYRPTDPIGGAIGGEIDNPAWPSPLVAEPIETFSPIKDPIPLPPPPSGAVRYAGDAYPKPRAHSDYYIEPSYAEACDRLKAALDDGGT